MKKLLLLLFTNVVFSQEYLKLEEHKVYDIEIIIFAYENALPNPKNYSNSSEIDTNNSRVLLPKIDEELPLTRLSELDVIEDTENSEELTLPIDGETDQTEALVWFELDNSKLQLSHLWEKLDKTENIRPLFHKSWRQPETPFNQPEYVNIDSLRVHDLELLLQEKIAEENPDLINTTIDENPEEAIDFFDEELPTEELDNPQLKEDYHILGQVTLSKGRYLHFGNQLNLYRVYESIDDKKNMIFSLTERKQIKPGEIHYFDSPWFGSIVKVSEYIGEPEIENEESVNDE